MVSEAEFLSGTSNTQGIARIQGYHLLGSNQQFSFACGCSASEIHFRSLLLHSSYGMEKMIANPTALFG